MAIGIQDRRRPFTQIDDLIILDTSLTMKAKMAYVVLAQHASKEAICWPSVKRIAELAGTSVGSIKRGLKELVDAEYIGREERVRDDGGQTSNLYILIDLHNHPNKEQIFPPDHNDPPPRSHRSTPPDHNDPRTILNKNQINKNNNTDDNNCKNMVNPNTIDQKTKNVVVTNHEKTKDKNTEADKPSTKVDKLKEKYVAITSHNDTNFIDKLIIDYSEEQINDKLDLLKEYSNRNQVENAPGFICSALKNNYNLAECESQAKRNSIAVREKTEQQLKELKSVEFNEGWDRAARQSLEEMRGIVHKV